MPSEQSRVRAIPRYSSAAPSPIPNSVTIQPRTRILARGLIVMGGAPWRMGRIPESGRDLVLRLNSGHQVAVRDRDARLVSELVERGLVIPEYRTMVMQECTIVIPAFENPDQLDGCLESLGSRHRIIVIDDASNDDTAIRRTCARYGAHYVRHETNRGPAAARNTGLALADTEFVAFLDSDCIANADWITALLVHMEDPRMAVVAPRVVHHGHDSVVDRFERTDSALDMGTLPELVAPGSSLGYLPTAAWLARRAALGVEPFDESLRTGEDVDAIWQVLEAGWLVRYDPTVEIGHEGRRCWRELQRRRMQYGRSSRDLSALYPERLVPARISATSVALGIALALGRPAVAGLASTAAVASVARATRDLPDRPSITARLALMSAAADARALGSLLRREWWPVGAACLALAPRSRTARFGAAVMLVPLLDDWRTRRSTLDPLRYAGLRLMADAAYGTGVIAGAVEARSARSLLPRLRRSRSGASRHRARTR